MTRLVLVAAILATTACKSERTTATPPEQPTDDTPESASPGQGEEPIEPEPEEVCASGGRKWDGKPEGCPYEVARCCYDSPAQACAAAKCPESRCQILESYPAQIACREEAVGGSAE